MPILEGTLANYTTKQHCVINIIPFIIKTTCMAHRIYGTLLMSFGPVNYMIYRNLKMLYGLFIFGVLLSRSFHWVT